MTKNKYLTLIQELTSSVDAFQMDGARKTLKRLHPGDIPRELRKSFAQLARRCHMYNEAIGFLQPNIYGAQDATSEDLLEYASSIRKIGLVRQCRILLARADTTKDQVLYSAYCDVHEWDYLSAKLHFTNYLEHYQLSERENIVALLNLASCNLFLGDFSAAAQQLGLLSKIDASRYLQFFLNYRELLGQFHLLQGDYKNAKLIFEEALTQSADQEGNTALFLKKWLLISDSAVDDLNTESATALKKEIRKAAHWESLRDFEYQIARFRGKMDELKNIYFSTPYKGYRERIKRQTGIDFSKDTFVFQQRGSGELTFDPMNYTIKGVAPGMLLHRLLLLLLSDPFRPWSIPRIFDYLFCEEIYHPSMSPKKIYALTSKLQRILENSGLRLDSTVYGYRLRLEENARVQVYSEMIFSSRQELLTYSLKKIVGEQTFSVDELQNVIPLSKHKIYRLIQDIRDENVIEKIEGSSRYRLKAS
jgi:tetratricopeptide (TPR) repeat protein